MATDAPAGTIGPITKQERIQSLDVARGVAVLGILLMNIWAFAGPQAWFDYPFAIADRAGAPVATWIVVHTLFEGTQRALLSLLFGAGAAMALHRLAARAGQGGARAIYYRRTFGLIALGLVNAYVFLWPADILFVYGLAGLLLYPLHRLATPVLLGVVLVAMAVPTAMRIADIGNLRSLEAASREATALQATGATLDIGQQRAIDDWNRKLEKARPTADDGKIAADIALMQSGTLPQIAAHQAKSSLILQTIVAAKWWFLDALSMMVLGMLVYRTGILTRPAPARRYLMMAGIGLAIGLPLALWQTGTALAADFHPIATKVTQLAIDVRRCALAFGYLGLVLWFCHLPVGQAIKQPLVAVGRMALTNYMAQSVLCALVFYGFAFGLYGQLTGYQLYGVVALIWLVEVLWSLWWLARFRIGPLEWLWRSFTYRQKQAWKAEPSAAGVAADA